MTRSRRSERADECVFEFSWESQTRYPPVAGAAAFLIHTPCKLCKAKT